MSELPLNYQKLWLKQVCNIILRTLYVLINDRNSSLPDAKSEMIFSEWYLVISGHIIILHHATHVRHAATMTADKGGSSFVNQCLGKKTDREDNKFSDKGIICSTNGRPLCPLQQKGSISENKVNRQTCNFYVLMEIGTVKTIKIMQL